MCCAYLQWVWLDCSDLDRCCMFSWYFPAIQYKFTSKKSGATHLIHSLWINWYIFALHLVMYFVGFTSRNGHLQLFHMFLLSDLFTESNRFGDTTNNKNIMSNWKLLQCSKQRHKFYWFPCIICTNIHQTTNYAESNCCALQDEVEQNNNDIANSNTGEIIYIYIWWEIDRKLEGCANKVNPKILFFWMRAICHLKSIYSRESGFKAPPTATFLPYTLSNKQPWIK